MIAGMPMRRATAGTPRTPHLLSVGSKLAASTIALILVVTAGVYLRLSKWQRENLLQAREVSASTLTRLFIDSCAPALVFDDEQKIKEELTTLARNDDVEYAAVWRSDSSGGKLQLFGAFRRRDFVEVLTRVPVVTQSRRDRDRVILSFPIRDQNGALVGATVTAFSLIRENGAIAQMERTILIVSSSVAAGLTLLLMVMARIVLVGPLRRLVTAARELEQGGGSAVDDHLDIHTRDEVGQLASAFRGMSSAIKVREDRINTRNRDMRLVLDNVEQGFITLDLDGAMSDERSRVIDAWLGFAGGQLKFWDYLKRIDVSVGEWFEAGWRAIEDDVLPLGMCLDQLPRSASKDGRTFELAYRPILAGERLSKLIVVITDATSRIERERAEQGQREMMSVFRRMLSDRAALDEFFAETSDLVRSITASSTPDLVVLKRQIHTVKGNTALFGLESIAARCQQLEDKLAGGMETAGELTAQDRRSFDALWARVVAMRAQLTEGDRGGIELDVTEYAAHISGLRAGAPHEVLLSAAASWQFERASKRMALVGEQLRSLAARLNRAPVEVICQPTDLRLPPLKWGRFWSVFAHVIRNTADHGIETAEGRALVGKSPTATIRLGMVREGQWLSIFVEDDGPGIDWDAITARAKERGLRHVTRDDLEETLFVDGVSTRRTVTANSGRGVGLSAVRDAVRSLGGRIEIQTRAGQGTTFRFVLPESLLREDESPSPPPSERDSGSPVLPEAPVSAPSREAAVSGFEHI